MRSHQYLLAPLLCLALAATGLAADSKKKVVLIAGKPSHGYGAHEHNAGCDLLAHALKTALPQLEVEVIHNGWPQDEKVLDGAATIVMYCDGGGGHMVLPHKKEVDALAKQGVGIVCLHYAVEVPKENGGQEFLDWIGGYFEMNWSVNPTWTAEFDKLPDHPITRGVKPFAISDEWYYHMRFRPGMQGVTPILTTLPPESTLSRPDGTHSGNPDVRRDVLEKKEPQHVAWASENPGGGRGFGFTGGHDHWNWGEPNFRRLVLNAIVWTAQLEVPTGGVRDAAVSIDDLVKNQDEPIPANLDREAIRKKISLPLEAGAAQQVPPAAARKAPKPIFASPLVSKSTPGHAVDIDVDIQGAQQLYLVVGDGGDGFAADWADWCEPRLVGPGGEMKLTDLKWKLAESDWGSVNGNRRADGMPLRVGGKSVDYGIGTHANSVIAFDLPPGYQRFKARGGLDEGGSGQPGSGSTVSFAIYRENPGLVSTNKRQPGAAAAASHDAERAVASLDVATGCQATLFSSEPQISNIVSIDVDALGRVWAAEVQNYRHWNGSRPEGDRILVLEDTDGDGRADKQTVFYQGRDIDSAHGHLRAGQPGDRLGRRQGAGLLRRQRRPQGRPERKRCSARPAARSTIIGIHAVSVRARRQALLEFRQRGQIVHDKQGKPVVDLGRQRGRQQRQPYQAGMVLRCDLDGSRSRGRWPRTSATITSWRSIRSAASGSRTTTTTAIAACRINYMLEYGNYGYTDEVTGAGWQDPRTNLETDIPLAALALERSGRGAQSAAHRRRLADRHRVYEGDVAAAGFSRTRSSTVTPGRMSAVRTGQPRREPATRPKA